MGTPKLLAVLISLLWLLPSSLGMLQTPTQVAELPACAAQCWALAVPPGCGSLDNSTCICTPGFERNLMSCLEDNCPLLSIYAGLQLSQRECDRPRRSRKEVIWAILPLHIFAMICVITRLYAKAFVLHMFGADDWIMLVTMFLYFGWFCVGHHLFAMAFGEDIWWVDPDDLTNAMLLLYLSMPIYLSLLGLAKAALVCFYLRLFPHQRFRRLCYIVLAIVACLTVAWTAISIFECTPIHYNWDGWKEEMTGTCIDRLTLMYVISGVNIGLDAAIMAMPIPLVLKMRSTPRRKFSIIVMFSLGILVLAASSIRLHYIVVFGGSKNFTYDFVDMLIWTGIEIAVSIITTSLPCIRLMLHRRFPGLLTRIFRLGGHGDDREYVEKYLEPQKAIRTPTVRSRRFILFNRHEPPVPPTIGGDIQEDISPKKQLEARKAKHMAALRRGVGDASRALASILGTVTDTLHRPMSISVLASGDRETENRMGMGMAPSAFARTLNERLDGIRSSIGALPKEKPPKSL